MPPTQTKNPLQTADVKDCVTTVRIEQMMNELAVLASSWTQLLKLMQVMHAIQSVDQVRSSQVIGHVLY